MAKSTVCLDAADQRRLRALARRVGRPQAELIREAIAEYLERHGEPPIPSWVGMISTDGLDSAKVHGDRDEWIDDVLRRKTGG